MSNINVNSIGSLEELETCLVRFAAETNDALRAIQREIQRKSELIDQIVDERGRAVTELEWASRDTEDEEDGRVIRKQLEDAEEKLRDAKKWQRRVEEACIKYKKHSTQVQYLAGKHTERSRTFLRGRIDELYNYAAFNPQSSPSNK